MNRRALSSTGCGKASVKYWQEKTNQRCCSCFGFVTSVGVVCEAPPSGSPLGGGGRGEE